MNGVFQGVIIPTGPIGLREVTFIWSGANRLLPSRAVGARSAKKRKFSAARSAAFDMKRRACPVSIHSSSAISSARATMPSAIRCNMALRLAPAISRHSAKACVAARAARSISAASPRATSAMRRISTGDTVSNVLPDSAGTAAPAMWFRIGALPTCCNSVSARERLSARVIWCHLIDLVEGYYLIHKLSIFGYLSTIEAIKPRWKDEDMDGTSKL